MESEAALLMLRSAALFNDAQHASSSSSAPATNGGGMNGTSSSMHAIPTIDLEGNSEAQKGKRKPAQQQQQQQQWKKGRRKGSEKEDEEDVEDEREKRNKVKKQKKSTQEDGGDCTTFGACDFCRRRHMTCVGRPVCNNCKRREQPCVFTPKKKPGPPLGFKRPGGTSKETPSCSPPPSSQTQDSGSSQHPSNGCSGCPSRFGSDDSNGSAQESGNGIPPLTLTYLSTNPEANARAGAGSTGSGFQQLFEPYSEYVSAFRARYQEGPLAMFTFVEIPSMEMLLPLAATSVEGRLRQMLLFSILGVGAYAQRNRERYDFFSNEANRLYSDHLRWKHQEEEKLGRPAELSWECDDIFSSAIVVVTFLTHCDGNLERGRRMALHAYHSTHRLIEHLATKTSGGNVSPATCRGAMDKYALAICLISSFLDRDAFHPIAEQLLQSQVSVGVKVWLYNVFIFDDLLDYVANPATIITTNDLTRMSHLLMEVEELLLTLQTDIRGMPPAQQGSFTSLIIRVHSTAFLATKGVLSYLLGYSNTAATQLMTATRNLLSLPVQCDVLFLTALLAAVFLAKVHRNNKNMEMYQRCIEFLRTHESLVPCIHYAYPDLFSDNPKSWFPAVNELLTSIRVNGRTQIQVSPSIKHLDSLLRTANAAAAASHIASTTCASAPWSPSAPSSSSRSAPNASYVFSTMSSIEVCDSPSGSSSSDSNPSTPGASSPAISTKQVTPVPMPPLAPQLHPNLRFNPMHNLSGIGSSPPPSLFAPGFPSSYLAAMATSSIAAQSENSPGSSSSKAAEESLTNAAQQSLACSFDSLLYSNTKPLDPNSPGGPLPSPPPMSPSSLFSYSPGFSSMKS